jgi:sugar-specific transcriptional regulator TrmB
LIKRGTLRGILKALGLKPYEAAMLVYYALLEQDLEAGG